MFPYSNLSHEPAIQIRIFCAHTFIHAELGIPRLPGVFHPEGNKRWLWLLESWHWRPSPPIAPRAVHAVDPVGGILPNVQDPLYQGCIEWPQNMGLPPGMLKHAGFTIIWILAMGVIYKLLEWQLHVHFFHLIRWTIRSCARPWYCVPP